jgi:hypothetical protein
MEFRKSSAHRASNGNHSLVSRQAAKATKAQKAGSIANAGPAMPSDIANAGLQACPDEPALYKSKPRFLIMQSHI